MRAGTENVILIVGMGEAARLSLEEERELLAHMLVMKRRLLVNIIEQVGRSISFRFNGPRSENSKEGLDRVIRDLDTDLNPSARLKQLPNTLSVSFQHLKMHEVMPKLHETVACSAGSACHSGDVAMSPVLAAMKVPPGR